MKAAGLLSALCALLLQCCHGAWTAGSVVLKPNSTIFIAKFCFSFNPEGRHRAGLLDVRIRTPKNARYHDAHVALLDDEMDSYPGPSSEWNKLTCEQRLQRTKQSMFIDWRAAAFPEGQELSLDINQKLRPRWWYLVLLDCTHGENVPDATFEYEAHFVNPMYGSFSEFSTDRRHNIPLFLLLALAYAAMTAAQFVARAAVAQKADGDSATGKAAHPFTRILSIGVALGFLEATLFAIHNFTYMYNGVGAPMIAVAAQLVSTTSCFILASLLLLVSEGKCVSYIMVSGDARRMFRLLGPFVVSCCCLELWGEYSVRQHYTTDYVYTTPFGWALIFVDVFLLGVYATNMRATFLVEKERDDGVFYRTWGVVFGVWFLALPVTAVLARAVLAPYVWLTVSVTVKQGATAMVYGALIVGLWPGNTRSYFKLESADDQARQLTSSANWRSPTGQQRPPLLPAPKKMPILLGSSKAQAPERQSFHAHDGQKAERSAGRRLGPSMSP